MQLSLREDSTSTQDSPQATLLNNADSQKAIKPHLPTFLSFSEVGLRIVSSGRLGLGLGDSQELKKDWMKGSRCCPFCHKKKHTCKMYIG